MTKKKSSKAEGKANQADSPKGIILPVTFTFKKIQEIIKTGLAMSAKAEDDSEVDLHNMVRTGLMLSEESRNIMTAYEHNPLAAKQLAAFVENDDDPDFDTIESFKIRNLLARFVLVGLLAGSSLVLSTGGAE